MAPDQDHKQQNIYVQNFIRLRHYAFSEAYSELIGRLCAAESALTMSNEPGEGFSGELLNAFRGFAPYDKVDRVCLAMRVGLSNELYTIDSRNSARANENQMQPGYRCYVRPDSSLFALREGEIRIYDDATRIAHAFERRDTPGQRSLRYLMEMGFKSGICVPLHFAGELRGFLFFNSADYGLFSKLHDEDYAVLNVVAMIAKLVLMGEVGCQVEYALLRKEPFANFTSRLFDEDEFARQIQCLTKWFSASLWRPKVKCEGQCDFLYSPTGLAYSIAKIATQLYPSGNFPKEMTVSSKTGADVDVQLPVDESAGVAGLDHYRARVGVMQLALKFLRATLVPGINCVTVRFPYDRFSGEREDILYSV